MSEPFSYHPTKHGLAKWLGLFGALGVVFVSTASTMPALAADAAAPPFLPFLDANAGPGLIVHLGCGDGKETVALAAGAGRLVQGLVSDDATVAKARASLQSSGLYGKATISRYDGKNLPYADGIVNLLIADDRAAVSDEEIQRVLAPEGKALVRNAARNGGATGDGAAGGGGAWQTILKPRPAGMDDWTHYLHGPDGNPVGADSLVGEPFHIQWAAGPAYSKSHGILSSVDALVSAGGRIFYIADEGPTALANWLPPSWNLVARDAFSGVALWRQPLVAWQPINVKNRHQFPPDLYRRLVASKDRVFVTLDLFGPVVALETETGKTALTFKGTEGAEEIIYDGHYLYLVIGTKPAAEVNRRALADTRTTPESKRIMAVRASDGAVVWERLDDNTLGLMPMTLAVCGNHVFFQNTKELVCLDANSGKTLWRAPHPVQYARAAWSTTTLLAFGDVVLVADREPAKSGKDLEQYKQAAGTAIAFSAETGKRLWSTPCAEGVASPMDMMVVNDQVWIGEQKARSLQDYAHGRDLHTGAIKTTIPPSPEWADEHHHRCYKDKGTGQFILAGRQGIEFINTATRQITGNLWTRGICHYGVMPCNGLIYVPPNQCGCYVESKLHGFLALAPKSANESPLAPAYPLEAGPALSDPQPPQSAIRNPQSDWPTYRHDAARSGATKAAVPASLKPLWSTDLGGKLSAPVCADGRLLVSQIDRQTVVCLNADSGAQLWAYAAGGCVDSPPTLASGLAVFGDSDGWVTALRAADGALAWRFRAAPADRQIVSRDRLESSWPCPGSVLVLDGAVYCAAGRSSYVDGGMFLHKLDLATGRPLVSRQFSSRDPQTGKAVELYKPRYTDILPGRELPGLLPDVLSYDGANLYMRAVPFSGDLAIQYERNRPHLFCSMGFLDDAWWERTYWIYGEHMYSGAAGIPYAQKISPSGRIMVCDDENVYAYRDLNEGGRAKDVAGLVTATPREPRLAESKAMKKKAEGAKKKKFANAKLTEVVLTWTVRAPVYADAMVLAGDTLFLAGPLRFDEAKAGEILSASQSNTQTLPPTLQSALDTFEGKKGSLLWAVNKSDGKKVGELKIESKPVHDGLIALPGRLCLSTAEGKVVCLGQ